jgi:hypothetical protein
VECFTSDGNEVLHPPGILLSGLRLDAAGYVDGVRTYNADCVGYIVRRQATGQDQWQIAQPPFKVCQPAPIYSATGAAKLARCGRIDQHRGRPTAGNTAGGNVVGDGGNTSITKPADADDIYLRAQLRQQLGRLVAVQLDPVQPYLCTCAVDLLGRRINEYAHSLCRNSYDTTDDLCGLANGYHTPTALIEVEADGISAGCNRRTGVIAVCHSTNLDLEHCVTLAVDIRNTYLDCRHLAGEVDKSV